MKLDLNCDLGEGEPLARTRALMRWVSSVNVACGGHAGNARTMQTCVELAKALRVHVGAHPGAWSRSDRGRGPVQITPDELELLLLHQVGAFHQVCQTYRLPLHHIKLHGSLYHLTEMDEALGRRYLRTVRHWWPKAIVYVRASGKLVPMARAAGVCVWEEAFADRGYQPGGTLVPRDQPGALLTDIRLVVSRLETLCSQHQLAAVDGSRLRMHPQTLCLHSDSPNATRLARALARFARLNSRFGRARRSVARRR